MNGRIPARSARLAAAILATAAVTAIAAGTASAEVVYNNIPATLPGNFASIGLAATSTTEFGGEVELAGTARKNPTVTVVMSSWACQSGSWNEHDCQLPKSNKGFKVPVTFRVYEAGELKTPIVTKTKSFKMSYRPAASSKCTGEYAGTWYDEASKECFNGYAFPISINLRLQRLPKKAVITVSYPTSGPSDSLNVAVSEPSEKTLTVGSDPVEEWFANSTWSEMYCPGAKDVGTLGPEEGTGCQGVNYQPVIAISAL
ncbi:MAG: hypothetical protein ABSB69_11370 [Solirubrobacteraceae bacterium]